MGGRDRGRRPGRVFRAIPVGAALCLGLGAASASASVPHAVQPGETLWSISAANNLTTRTVAAYNGLSEDAVVMAGQTIDVPTVEEGAAALAEADAAVAPEPAPSSAPASPAPPAGTEPSASSAPGMGHIPSPWGELHLAPAAADAWNAMREESLRIYGVDLHPAGPLSAYRSYAEQAAMYEAYLAGTGPLAAPPGGSAHELGTSVDLATPEMRSVIDEIGAAYGWAKVEAPEEWWHVNYVGP